MQITCHKTGHHAVACAYAVHDLALGAADAVHLAVLIHQQSAVPGHAHQYVPGTLFLQDAGGGGDLCVRFQLPAHDLAQLVIVGLDQEGVIGEDVDQQILGGIHHGPHAVALQPCQQPLVGALGKALGDAACQNEDVVRLQGVQLGFQLLHGTFRDAGACAVQLRLGACLDLDVDAGHALGQMDEIGPEPLRGQITLQPGTGLTGHKAQSHALTAQLPEHAGNIDALAAQHAVLPGGAVHLAHLKGPVETDHIINGRIERYSVDHTSVSFIRVYCRYLGLGHRFVRMAPLCRSQMAAG